MMDRRREALRSRHDSRRTARWTNENTNGLVRDFFPKGTNFDEISGEYITWMQNALNDRSRKRLEWFTPRE